MVEGRLGMQQGFGESGQQEIPEVGVAQGFQSQLQSVLRHELQPPSPQPQIFVKSVYTQQPRTSGDSGEGADAFCGLVTGRGGLGAVGSGGLTAVGSSQSPGLGSEAETRKGQNHQNPLEQGQLGADGQVQPLHLFCTACRVGEKWKTRDACSRGFTRD